MTQSERQSDPTSADTPEETSANPSAEAAATENAAPAEGDAAPGESAAQEALAQAQARVAELEAKLAEMNDKALRALAEAENTRKRMEKERQDTAKFAVSAFARDLLTVADNLGRALEAITPEQRAQNEQLKNIYTGVEATEREMMRLMESNGIRKVEAMGKAFDPNLHEVMFEIDAPDRPPGIILQVLEPGYTIHERLLRPARVGVSKGGAPAEGGHLDESV